MDPAIAEPPAPQAATPDTAEALRRLANARDPSAWEALLERNGADILRIARRILGDHALAEDACQETLLQVRAHAGAFKPPSSPEEAPYAARAWVMRIATCTALNMLRSRARERRREERVVQATARNGETATASPAARHLREEEAECLRREVAGLPGELRETIILHFYGGLDYRALSLALSCSAEAARKRVQRGLERLRTRLALLGLVFTMGELTSGLSGQTAQAAEAAAGGLASGLGAGAEALDAAHLAAWKALLGSPLAPKLAGIVSLGGMSIMAKISLSLAAVALAGAGAVAVRYSLAEDGQPPKPVAATAAPEKANASGEAPKADDGAAAEVRKKLSRRVSFEFVDTPLTDAIAFLGNVTGVKMVLDPQIAAAGQAKITLRVTDMTVELALQWVVRLAELDYTVTAEGVVISKAKAQAAAAPSEQEPPWVQEIRKKLQRRVTFEFVETPLTEGVSFLRSLTNVNMVVDPKALAAGQAKITLRVTDVTMEEALKKIVQQAGMEYDFRDQAIFIGRDMGKAPVNPVAKPPKPPEADF
jgi:RNA polymerase sigma-70 factor (ECF subfamily)